MVGYSPHSSNADEGGYDDSDEPSLDRVIALLHEVPESWLDRLTEEGR